MDTHSRAGKVVSAEKNSLEGLTPKTEQWPTEMTPTKAARKWNFKKAF